MRTLLTFLVLIIDASLTAIGVMAFIGASDALSAVRQAATSFGGLGGVVMGIIDYFSEDVNLAEDIPRLEMIRLGGLGCAVFGGFIALFALIRAIR